MNNRNDKNRKLASHVRNVNLTFARANKCTSTYVCMCNMSELKPFCYYAIVDITMQPPYVEGVAIQCDESSIIVNLTTTQLQLLPFVVQKFYHRKNVENICYY